MNQRLKRMISGILAILTLFTTMFADLTPVFAASPSANMSFWYASVKDHGRVTGFSKTHTGSILYAVIDGHSAYCMNFGLSAKGGQLMTSDTNSTTTMTDEQRKLLGYCMYFGYSTTEAVEPSDDQKNQYIATQAMVWIIEEGLFGTEISNTSASDICACAPDASAAYSYYVALKDKISGSYYAARPSFASKTMSGAPSYELKWNEANKRYEYSFNDTNGVLSKFLFNIDGYNVDKNGNNMTIYTKNANTTDTMGSFTSVSGEVETTTTCVFWLTGKEGDQEFVSEQPQADPISAYIKVKTESLGYGEITKTDKSTGKHLAGAVYGIYSDSGCKTKVDTMTTDKNGYAKSKALTPGTYYVKEITAPKGYVKSDKVHTLTVKAGQTTGISLNDVEQFGSLTIYKEGEVLTGWNGKNFVYEKKKLQGATFKVTAGDDIYKADGTLVYKKGADVKTNLVTGKDGQVVLSDLHLGTYVVTETKSIDGFTINAKPQTVKIQYKNQNITVQSENTTIFNTRQKADVSVIKVDADTKNPLAGGEYSLYAGNNIKNASGKVIVKKGTLLQTITSGKDGKASYSVDLPVGNSYYIAETKAPKNYQKNSLDVFQFSFEAMSQDKATATFNHTFKNDRTTAKIQIFKVDKETGKAVPQGDASLKGAVYGLYARENIKHPDSSTGIVYKKDELIAKLTTDDAGKSEIDNLYLGKYYVKEIEPSEGYLLDEEEHDIICDYEGDGIPQVLRSTVSKEQVIKQPFQLIKISDDGNETESNLLKGAGFTAYLKSSLKVKKDGSYDLKNAKPVVIGTKGETTIYTDKKGYVCSEAIPYGTYVVIESVTPHNMDTIKPFEVAIKKNNPDTPQVWRVFVDREFTAKLRIIKKDAKTKRTVLVPNAEFKIYNLDTKQYVKMTTTYPSKVTHTSFFTDGDGDLILPERLNTGKYRIEEVTAPNGYLLNNNYVNVTIDTDTFYEVDPDTFEAIITVEYEDTPVEGELTVIKKGEVLDGYKGSLIDENGKFVYREGNLSGAKFEVYANEDIVSPDGQTDDAGNKIIVYSKDELVATLETGNDGKAVLKNLPLGQYRVVETEAPFGYVLNSEEQIVTFTYVDDKTPVIYENATFMNDRQKFSLSVEKKDEETKEPIEGAAFGLFADEDIKNIDGKVIIQSGTMIESAVSDKNGIVKFVEDYPIGKYTAKELAAPKGYVSSEKIIQYDAQYKGQTIPVVEMKSEYLNTPTSFEFSKEDISSGAELSGATLSVIDGDGNTIETWKSVAGEKHIIKRLTVGETYILREEYAPYGYLKASDVTFNVEDTKEIQSVVMKDEVPTGTIIINKDGEFVNGKNLVKGLLYNLIFDYHKKSLAGVTFNVYAKKDIVSPDGLDNILYKADQLVDTIVTDDMGIAKIDNLPLGKYYLVETKTIEGFVLDETPIDAELMYVDQDTKVVYAGMDVTNDRQKVEITVAKKDAETKKPLAGAEFGLYAQNDIVNDNGDVVVAADEQIEKAVSGKDGKAVFVTDLPLGIYYVKELTAPEGYVKSDKKIAIDASYQGEKYNTIELYAEFENKPTKAEFSKTDITGDKELAGASLSVIDADGKVIESWVSEAGKTHMIERLKTGKYILREETSPYGYKMSKDVEFEITETEDIQKVVMKDEYAVGKIVIEKTDAETKKPIAGVEFEIRDKDGKVIDKVVTDENGKAQSKELPICIYNEDGSFKEDIHYYVVETKAAAGYIKDDTVHEIVLQYDDNAPECVVYKLELTNKPDKPKLPQTGDDYNPWIYVGLGALAVVMGLLATFAKKKESKN